MPHHNRSIRRSHQRCCSQAYASFRSTQPRTALAQAPSRQAHSRASQIPLRRQRQLWTRQAPQIALSRSPTPHADPRSKLNSQAYRGPSAKTAGRPTILNDSELPGSSQKARYNPRTSPRAIRRSDRIPHDRCAGNHGNAPRGSASAAPRRSKRGTATPYDRRPPQSTRDATAHP